MIDKGKMYNFIYTSVSFTHNSVFCNTVKDKFDAVVPYCDIPELNPALKESLDSYIYVEAHEQFTETYKKLCKLFSKVSFTILGSIRGKDIANFFNTCKEANMNYFKVGDTVKLLRGTYKGLSGKISAMDDTQVIFTYSVLNSVKNVACNISDLVAQESYESCNLHSFQNMEDKHSNIPKVCIVDGDNCLFRSMQNIPNKYNSKGEYIGGFIGFYFSLLKLKEMYPEYPIQVVFEGAMPEHVSKSEKLQKAYLQNKEWCIAFVKELNYHCVIIEGCSFQTIISEYINTKHPESNVILFSSNPILRAIVNERITLFYPKTTYRGHSQFYTVDSELPDGLNAKYKLPWLYAFIGVELGNNIPSYNQTMYVKYGPKHNTVNPSDFIEILNKVETEEELLQYISSHPKMSDFLPTLKENLRRVRLLPERGMGFLQETRQEFDNAKIQTLLEDIEMYREIEFWDKSERIFRGLW